MLTHTAEALARGVRFTEKPRQESYGLVVVFLDLYGNKWTLCNAIPSSLSLRHSISGRRSCLQRDTFPRKNRVGLADLFAGFPGHLVVGKGQSD